MTKRDFEILVVGAGPAGSLAARRLADAGHEVALVDENDAPRCSVICSGIVSLEAYDRFELPREAVVDTIHDVTFFSPAGEEFRYKPERPLAHVVDRTLFDGALTESAAASGVCLMRGHSATHVSLTRRGVALTVRTSGSERTLRGSALIVATGYRSRLHGPAGLGRPSGHVQGTHYEIPSERLREAEVYFGRAVAPGFFAWAIPYGSSAARVGVMTARAGRNFLESFVASGRMRSRSGDGQAHVSGNGHGPAGENGHACANGRMMSRGIVQGPVQPSVADRVVAVGEAAGQVKTTTGGGLYYGLIGAELAADVLSPALGRDRLTAAALGRYHTAWMRRFGHEIRTGLRLQRLGDTFDDGDIDELFRLLQGSLGNGMSRLVRFDWHRNALRLLFTNPRLQWMIVRRLVMARLCA